MSNEIFSKAKVKKNSFLPKNQRDETILFSSVLSDFLVRKQNSVKASTLARYRDIIKLHIMPELGDMQLHEINSKSMEMFANRKIKSGRVDGTGGLSPKRVRDILSVIKLTLTYAKEEGFLHQNVNFSFPRINKPRIEIFNKEEEARLLSHSIEKLDPLKCGFITSLCTGIRIGELCALRWEDIDIENGLITINKTLQRIPDLELNHKTRIIIGSPKSDASERQIPIPALLQKQLKCVKPKTVTHNCYILTSNEKYIEPSNCYVKYQQWLNECGIAKHSFHALRHTFATRAIECGVDVKTLSEILGHSDVKITLSRYVHPSMDLKQLSMAKINTYMRNQLKL